MAVERPARGSAPAQGSARRAGRAAALLALTAAAAGGQGLFFSTLTGSRRGQQPGPGARGRGALGLEAVKPCKSEAFLDEAIANTANEEPNVLIVSYSTTWCGPCKLMDPKVDELSETFADKANFIKVMGDKDDNDGIRIMRREGVRTVPLYQIYKDGAKVDSISGADPEALTRHIEKHVGK